MEELRLVIPTAEYADAIMDFRREMLDAGSSFDGCNCLENYARAEDWLEHIQEARSEELMATRHKVASDLWLAVRKSDGRIVGIIDFRHSLDHPVLAQWGGHIGYCVRPSERRKGYAKEMLRMDLECCKVYGLDRVLVCCHKGNLGSERTILANGGVFEKEIEVDGKHIRRFWIDLT